ncbi:MAG: hypothetical protein IJV26_09090, partial [Lachnospiraceae bacterium]|nr:hypothetical protein [Lachnospiraceae bacterium]
PRDVRLVSESAQKEYNGSELKAGKVEVQGDGFAEGEGAEYEVTGTQTLAGSSRNTFTYRLNEGTKEQNYRITVQEGTLTVLNRDAQYGITVEGASLTTLYDGKQHTVNGLVSRTFRVEGKTYQVSGLTAEGSGKDAGTYAVAVTGTPTVTDEDGNDVTAQFRVTTKDGQLTITKREVILTSASESRIYDGTPLRAERVAVSGDGFAEGEGAVYDVTGSRTVIGSSENTFVYTLTGGAQETNYNIHKEFGSLTVISRPENALLELDVTAPGGTFLYDGTAHSVSGLAGAAGRGRSASADGEASQTIQVTVNGQQYTVSGLEASRSETAAGTYTVNITGTPVVVDEDGNDVSSQFIIRPHSSELTILPREVILTSGSASHAYNGRALTNNEVTVSGDGFAEGEGADYTVTGSRMIVGESENSFTYELKDGTNPQNYRIRTVFGTLSVTNRDAKYLLSVKAQSMETIYDGEEQTVSGLEADTFELEGNLYRISGLQAQASAVDAGTYEVPVTGTAIVTDASGSDVTDQFMIRTEPGTLKIGQRRIVLRSTDIEGEYNGQAVTGGEVRITSGSFAAGEGAGYVLTGSRILPGVSPNTFKYTLKDGTKAANYDIQTQEGLITVVSRNAPYEITLQAKGDNLLYDGEAHTVEGFEETEFVIEGSRYTVEGLSAGITATEAGTYPVEIAGTARVLDAEGNDVTDQFAVRVIGAELTIRGLYQLTIQYQDENGRTLAPSFTGWYEAGESFGPVASPQIHGYTPNVRSVQSGEAGMPEQDVTITVYYTADAQPGGGPGETVSPEPEKPDTPETPDPGTGDVPETPEEPGVVPAGETQPGQTPAPAQGSESVETPAGEMPEAQPVQTQTGKRAPAGVLTITEEGSPEIVHIEDLLVPLSAVPIRHGYWALLNLLAAIAAVVLAILLILSGRRRKEDEEEDENPESMTDEEAGAGEGAAEDKEEMDAEEEEDPDERKKKRLWKLLSVVIAIVSVIVFVVTEDMTNTMRLLDRWTILMVLLLIGQVVVVFLSRRKKNEEEEEQDEESLDEENQEGKI